MLESSSTITIASAEVVFVVIDVVVVKDASFGGPTALLHLLPASGKVGGGDKGVQSVNLICGRMEKRFEMVGRFVGSRLKTINGREFLRI